MANEKKFEEIDKLLEDCSYNSFLEIMKIEFGDFLRLAESGRTVRHSSLKARQQSLKLRYMLKQFRAKAIENDKKISRIMSDAKQKLNDEIG